MTPSQLRQAGLTVLDANAGKVLLRCRDCPALKWRSKNPAALSAALRRGAYLCSRCRNRRATT